MVFQSFPVEFDKRGAVHDEQQVRALLDGLSGVTDLFVASHGWNNDVEEAQELYTKLFGHVAELAAQGGVPGLEQRRFAVMQIFWPSKKFAEKDLIPGGGAASAAAAGDKLLEQLLEELKNDPERLGERSIDPVRAASLDRAKELVPRLKDDAAARERFVWILRSIMSPLDAEADDGSDAFFTADEQDLFRDLGKPVPPPPAAAGSGGGAGLGGGAAGLGDLLDGAKAAARRMANFVTYYQMKDRAGLVGRTGVAGVLKRVRQRQPGLKLHLVGHSFGGRLVTAAAHGLPANTPNVSLALLQAAFSHNALSKKYDGKKDGSFRALIEEKRASGPIVITHTKNDKAVGLAYPLASRIAFQKAAAIGDANDPYGGMGRNGAQRTSEVATPHQKLGDVGTDYVFEPGRIYNLNADAFVRDHGDVDNRQVAYAVLSCASRL